MGKDMTDRSMRLSRLGRYTALLVMLRAAVVAAHPGVFHDIERISKEIEKQPNRVVLLIDRGMYYRMACEFALSAVRTDWLLRRADALVPAGRPSEAETDRARALEEADRALAKRQSATLQMARTRVLVSMGKRAEAQNVLEVVLKMSPRMSEARALLGELDKPTNPTAGLATTDKRGR